MSGFFYIIIWSKDHSRIFHFPLVTVHGKYYFLSQRRRRHSLWFALQKWQWWELLEKEGTCISAPVSNKKQKFSASEKRNSTGTSLLHRKKTVLLFFREKKQYFPSSQKRSSTYLFQRKEAALLRFKEKKQHLSSSEKRSSTSPLQRKEAARIFF